MMQPLARKNLKKNSLRRGGSARTVLLRMAADQERADRIRALKESRPGLTWRRIGDHVGVSERSAFEWGKKGGIEYDNAKKLAELFEVDADYIWRGAGITAPDLFANQDDGIAGLEERLGDVETKARPPRRARYTARSVEPRPNARRRTRPCAARRPAHR
jgi:hypothetical protein